MFLQHLITAYLNPICFRAGHGRIVRWAQEDVGFLEDEEDFMVNGGMDEQIPLKQSPRQTRLFSNYGSAP
jgi:hypothetical protein